jgi:DNA-binding XRE family transcriptional regulator
MRMMPKETLDTQPRPLDISKLEILRNHLMLDKSSMARVLGVSRVSYHAWLTVGK